MTGCAGHQADTLQLRGSDRTLEAQVEAEIATRVLRLQPGVSDCKLEDQIAAWGHSLDAQIGAWRLRRLSGQCRAVATDIADP